MALIDLVGLVQTAGRRVDVPRLRAHAGDILREAIAELHTVLRPIGIQPPGAADSATI
jgi:hypothetical protein